MAVPALLPVSKVEIKRTAFAVKAKVAASMDDSTASGDEVSLSSRLAFDDLPEARERDGDYVLTKEERRTLPRGMAKVNAIAEEPAESGLVGQDVPDYVPILDAAFDVFARAQAAFELDAEALPLRLMA
jgi:hypothetical protein